MMYDIVGGYMLLKLCFALIIFCLELTAAGCRNVGLRRRSISPSISAVEGNVALSKLH
jgi:hypothetical protein